MFLTNSRAFYFQFGNMVFREVPAEARDIDDFAFFVEMHDWADIEGGRQKSNRTRHSSGSSEIL